MKHTVEINNEHERSAPLCIPLYNILLHRIISHCVKPNCTVSYCYAVGGRIVSYLTGVVSYESLIYRIVSSVPRHVSYRLSVEDAHR